MKTYIDGRLLSEIVLSKKYTGETFRVLFLLLDRVDKDNRIRAFSQQEIANRLEISQSNVSKSLRRLLDDNIIYRDEREWYFSQDCLSRAEKIQTSPSEPSDPVEKTLSNDPDIF